MKKIKKEYIFNTLIVIVIILLYVFDGLFSYTNVRKRKRKEIVNGIVDKVDKKIDDNKNAVDNNEINESMESNSIDTNYKGYNYTILGKIRIKKINIYQPIIKENTKDSLNVSAVKIAGPSLNTYGNVVIGGHNFMKGNFFIKINKLVKDDVIEITDIFGNTLNYYVYEYGITSIDDASYLKQPDDETVKMLTLVTCTKGGKERYYVKAKVKK